MAKKVLVFGATGEIGGRIAAGCVQAGYEVSGVSRGTNARHVPNLKGVKLLQGDKGDEAFIEKLASENSYDAVIDSVATLENVKLYHRYFHECENVVICSSTGTFVPLQKVPADETHPWREKTPVNFHNQSVRDAWGIDRFVDDGFGFSVLRPTNIIGYGRVPLELWGGRSIAFFELLRDHKPVVVPDVFDRILLQSGCNDDLANAFVKTVGRGKAIHGEIFIISCRQAITLKQYLETAMDFLGSRSEIQPLASQELLKHEYVTEGGLQFLLEPMSFSIEKAQRVLDYDPQYTAEQGLRLGLQWCQDTGVL